MLSHRAACLGLLHVGRRNSITREEASANVGMEGGRRPGCFALLLFLRDRVPSLGHGGAVLVGHLPGPGQADGGVRPQADVPLVPVDRNSLHPGLLRTVNWRRGRDSNPREAGGLYAISSRARSSTPAPLLRGIALSRCWPSRKTRSKSVGLTGTTAALPRTIIVNRLFNCPLAPSRRKLRSATAPSVAPAKAGVQRQT